MSPSALTDRELAGYARTAGFTGDALVTAIAVALAESGGNAAAIGDRNLVTDKWGPSVGLWQVRSLQAEKGSGGVRDELANLNPMHNAGAAFTISGGGRNWAPWSVFKSGVYQRFMDRARAASKGMAGGVPTKTESLPKQIGDAVGSVIPDPFGDLLGGVGRIVIMGLFVAGGVALIAMGGYRAVTSRGGP